MQKVTLEFVTPRAVMGEDGKPAIQYDKKTEVHLVASTKSFNNLVDDMKQVGKFPTASKQEEFFLNPKEVEKDLKETIKKHVAPDIVDKMTDHCMKALLSACVFKREKESK